MCLSFNLERLEFRQIIALATGRMANFAHWIAEPSVGSDTLSSNILNTDHRYNVRRT